MLLLNKLSLTTVTEICSLKYSLKKTINLSEKYYTKEYAITCRRILCLKKTPKCINLI